MLPYRWAPPKNRGSSGCHKFQQHPNSPNIRGLLEKAVFEKKSKKCKTVHRFSMALHHNAKMMCLKNAKTVFCKFAPLSACLLWPLLCGMGPLQSSSAALRGPLRGASLREPLCSSWAVQGCVFVFFQLYVPPLLPLFFFFPPSPFPSSFCVPLSPSPLPSKTKPQTLRRKRNTKP